MVAAQPEAANKDPNSHERLPRRTCASCGDRRWRLWAERSAARISTTRRDVRGDSKRAFLPIVFTFSRLEYWVTFRDAPPPGMEQCESWRDAPNGRISPRRAAGQHCSVAVGQHGSSTARQEGSTVVARAAGQHCSWRYVLWPYLCGGNGATWQISGGATWQRGRMAVLQRSSRAGSGAARQRGGGAARQHSSTVIRIDDAAHQHVSLGTGQHASMGRSRAAWQRGSWATGQPGSMQSNRAA